MNPTNIHIHVGTPCYGGLVTTNYFTSLFSLQDACSRMGINLSVLALSGDALITRARQNIMTCFLEDPTATHLMFIDADIGFDPGQVFRLLQFNKDITAGIYPLKRVDWARVGEMARRGVPDLESAGLHYVMEMTGPSMTVNGFARVAYAGTGFLLIRRSVFFAMMEKYPQLRYSGGGPDDPFRQSQFRYAFFNCVLDEKTGQFLPEDYSFCKLWTDMGGEIWGDLQSRLDHVGPAVFKGNAPKGTRSAPQPPAPGGA